jgi:hypothetical protein
MKNLLKKGMATIVVVLIAVVLSSAKPCPEGPVPECPFPDPPLSVFFPHPSDCHWFYHCSNGVAFCAECPFGLYWNVDLETCDYAREADCADPFVPQTEVAHSICKSGSAGSYLVIICNSSPNGLLTSCKPSTTFIGTYGC